MLDTTRPVVQRASGRKGNIGFSSKAAGSSGAGVRNGVASVRSRRRCINAICASGTPRAILE